MAEADLPPLLPDPADPAACTPCSVSTLGPAAASPAAASVWGIPQPASPVSYAPFGAPPPPFRGASGTFGSVGTFSTPGAFAAGQETLNPKLQGGPGPLLQGGPGRLACISAPAACMQSAAALDAVHYAARHAHMLQDLRGRPVRVYTGFRARPAAALGCPCCEPMAISF